MGEEIISESPERIVLENEGLRVVIDPVAEGKIRSFFSKRTQTEWFYADTRAKHEGAGFSDRDISGYEDCFPTVGPCLCPQEPLKGMDMGDHGLLWQRPWAAEIEGDRVRMINEIPELNSRFERICHLEGPDTLHLDYSIKNHGVDPFPFIFSAHPLLFATPRTEFIFPEEMKKVFVDFADNVPGLAAKRWIDWPPPGEMGLLPPYSLDRGSVVKLFSQKLSTGAAALRHRQSGETLRFEFDSQALPHLGILIMQGYDGRADGHFKDQFLLALEPTTAIGDDLETADSTGTLQTLAPGQELKFWIRLTLAP
jgi:hypothetical protein